MNRRDCQHYIKKGKLSECEMGKKKCQGERCTTFERREA